MWLLFMQENKETNENPVAGGDGSRGEKVKK